jgi:Protein of unknown function (DUF4058)
MPSPFPGMDPYIESRRIWYDFHVDLATEIRASLNTRIQPGYYATAVTYLAYDVIEITHTKAHSVSPDITVWRTQTASPTQAGTGTALFDPPTAQGVALVETPFRLANVEVREAGTDTLVTALEILSPINKRTGRERQKYLRKRRELLRSEVHVMEFDLLRGGERSPLESPLPPAHYYVTLCRIEQRPFVDVWPIQLKERLPVVPVPLFAPDPDVPLDLAALVGAVYERGGYSTRIDYRQPVPPPPLEQDVQDWVGELLATHRA